MYPSSVRIRTTVCQEAIVLDAIQQVKAGCATIMVMHKLPVLQMCNRTIILHEGVIARLGTYEELVNHKGVFATLASGGEWVGK